MTLEIDAKFEENLTCGLESKMRNLTKFHQSISKSQNWDFDGTLLCKVENLLAQNLHGSYMTMKNDTKIEEELTCQFKVDMKNLMSFDPGT